MASSSRALRAAALLTALAVAPAGLLVAPSAAAPSTSAARWSDTSVVRGDTVRVSVPAGDRPRGSRLVLQRKNLDGWWTVDPTARRSGERLVLRVPTGQLGTFGYRVAARRDGRTRVVAGTRDVRVRPAYRAAGTRSDHVFLGGRRFRWDSCRPVTWAFNPAHAPRRALWQVRTTMRLAARATGLRFTYVGRTTEKPTLRPHRGDYKVIVGWRTPRSFPYFRHHPMRVGVGGASWHSGFREADGTRVDKAWSGRLVLNARYDDALRRGYGRGYTWGDVLLHEFGHVLGLGHASSPSQLMFPEMTRREARWGAGDLAGLRRLGNVRGCLTRVGGRSHGHERAPLSSPPNR